MFSYKYPYTTFQKPTNTPSESGSTSVDTAEKTTEQIQSNNEQADKQRQERRQQADEQAVAKSSNPERAQQKADLLHTEVEIDGKTITFDEILHSKNRDELIAKLPRSKQRQIRTLIKDTAENQNQQAENQNQETIQNEEEEVKETEQEMKKQIVSEKNFLKEIQNSQNSMPKQSQSFQVENKKN